MNAAPEALLRTEVSTPPRYNHFPLNSNFLPWQNSKSIWTNSIWTTHIDDTLHAENLHLFPLDLFWKLLETYLPVCRPIIYSQSRWVGGFSKVRHHRRAPLSPPHFRNAGLMGISQREATFQSTRPQHTCRAPGVSCLHHASLDTGTGIDKLYLHILQLSSSQSLSNSQQHCESISDWVWIFLVSGSHIHYPPRMSRYASRHFKCLKMSRYAFQIQLPLTLSCRNANQINI